VNEKELRPLFEGLSGHEVSDWHRPVIGRYHVV